MAQGLLGKLSNSAFLRRHWQKQPLFVRGAIPACGEWLHADALFALAARDDTPGCTMEAIDFSELDDAFAKLKTVVLGVSMDDCVSHGAFRDKYGLSVQLLADMEGEVCNSYGVLLEKEYDGRKKMCIQRSTFIIDGDGMVKHAMYGVSARGHAATVLNLVKQLRKSNGSHTQGKHA